MRWRSTSTPIRKTDLPTWSCKGVRAGYWRIGTCIFWSENHERKQRTQKHNSPVPRDRPVSAGPGGRFFVACGGSDKASQREKLERLCRYITRPAVSEKRLSLTNQGKVRYELKTPYRDGTTHVIFEPVDFIAKLAASGAEAQSQPDAVSRCIRPEQQTPCAGDACKTGKRQQAQSRRMAKRSKHQFNVMQP